MRVKRLINGFENSQKIRFIVNGFSMSCQIKDILNISSTEHRDAINSALTTIGETVIESKSNNKVTPITGFATKYNEIDVQVDLIKDQLGE